jgi:hypothetical protein
MPSILAREATGIVYAAPAEVARTGYPERLAGTFGNQVIDCGFQ